MTLLKLLFLLSPSYWCMVPLGIALALLTLLTYNIKEDKDRRRKGGDKQTSDE